MINTIYKFANLNILTKIIRYIIVLITYMLMIYCNPTIISVLFIQINKNCIYKKTKL